MKPCSEPKNLSPLLLFRLLNANSQTVVVFALTPWPTAVGLHGMFTYVGCIMLFLNLFVVPMIIWGKEIGMICAKRYAEMVERQFAAKAI